MDSREFRNALGQFATGVCLVTVADAESGDLAMTVNSFASVSLEPPLVLWSIQNSAHYLRAFTECEHFAVSVLHADQQELCGHYARRDNHPINPAHFDRDGHGVPVLKGALATFSCRRWNLYDGGDHQIIVGEVAEFTRQAGDALAFAAGQFSRITLPSGD